MALIIGIISIFHKISLNTKTDISPFQDPAPLHLHPPFFHLHSMDTIPKWYPSRNRLDLDLEQVWFLFLKMLNTDTNISTPEEDMRQSGQKWPLLTGQFYLFAKIVISSFNTKTNISIPGPSPSPSPSSFISPAIDGFAPPVVPTPEPTGFGFGRGMFLLFLSRTDVLISSLRARSSL